MAIDEKTAGPVNLHELVGRLSDLESRTVRHETLSERIKIIQNDLFLLQDQIDHLFELFEGSATNKQGDGAIQGAVPGAHPVASAPALDRILIFSSGRAAADFYATLGFACTQDPSEYAAWFSAGDVLLGVGQPQANSPLQNEANGSMLLWFETTDDLDAVADRLRAVGAPVQVVAGSKRRLLYTQDPLGHAIGIFGSDGRRA